jgi:hypothetical protein
MCTVAGMEDTRGIINGIYGHYVHDKLPGISMISLFRKYVFVWYPLVTGRRLATGCLRITARVLSTNNNKSEGTSDGLLR